MLLRELMKVDISRNLDISRAVTCEDDLGPFIEHTLSIAKGSLRTVPYVPQTHPSVSADFTVTNLIILFVSVLLLCGVLVCLVLLWYIRHPRKLPTVLVSALSFLDSHMVWHPHPAIWGRRANTKGRRKDDASEYRRDKSACAGVRAGVYESVHAGA